MSEGFTKLFSSIITSSIWSEDDKTRLMWITMLATADGTGFVPGSIPGMAAIARMTLPEAEKSIAALGSPDPYSRTKDFEGRRLIETDGGWLIVNYTKYRQRRDPETRRQQNREAKRRQREKGKQHPRQQEVSQSQPKSAQAEAEAEAEVESVAARAQFRRPTPEEVTQYAKSKGYSLDGKYFCDTYEGRGWMLNRSAMKDWRAVVRTWQARDEKGNRKQGSQTTPTTSKPLERGPDGLTPRERFYRDNVGSKP